MNKAFEHQLGIPFDQYQRYKIVSDIVNKYRRVDWKFKILEIGASYEENLKNFLPDDNIYFLDIDYPEEYKQIKNYIIGDITKIELKDEYDFIVSIDCYEHILPNIRTTYVEKLIGQSRKATVIAAPFDTTGVKETEILVNDLYRLHHGEDHRWLKGHIENGLPSLSQTIRIIEDLGFNNYTILPNGYLARWFKMMSVILMAGGGAEYSQILKSLSEFYNRNFYKYDNTNPAYRQIIVISKISDSLDFKDLLSKDAEVDPDFKSRSDILQSFIERFETLFRNNSAYVKNFDTAIKETDTRIGILEEAIREKEAVLNNIYNSNGWKFLLKYYWIRNRIFPKGSKWWLLTKLTLKFPQIINLPNIVEGFYCLKDYGLQTFIEKVRNRRDEIIYTELYRLWVEKNEPKEKELERQRHQKFNYEPKISVIIPTFNTPKRFLSDVINSVLGQTYANWELCIVDGGSQNGDVKETLKTFSEKDNRIKVKILPENKGIASNSNEALSLATGDLIAFLDHDDTLAPFSFYEVIKAINENPDADFIYSDEDKILENGVKRFNPHFKPDWSPDTLRSYNYISHLTVIKRELLNRIGWFSGECEGGQDYDLILRATEQSGKIIHIPKILYHWRISRKSAAGNTRAKLYAYESAKKVLKDHVNRIGLNGRVEDGLFLGSYKITYPIGLSSKISIIIPNKDQAESLERCVKSIINRSTFKNIDILIVENGSVETGTLKLYDELKKWENIRIIEWKKPFNYSAINNFAVRYAKGEVILFLNNDTEIINQDWLERMLEHVLRRDVGAVGAKLYYDNDEIQHAGVVVGLGGVAGHPHRYSPKNSSGYMNRLRVIHNLSAVTGASLMTKRGIFEQVGGFDERLAFAFNDIDLCLKMREEGYLIIWTPYAELHHHESKTRGYEDTPEKQERFRREIEYFRSKWKHVLKKGDPYYNPNLTLDREDFSIKI